MDKVIVGSGIDIIEIKRLKQAVTKWGDTFLRRVFTKEEIAYAKNRRFPYQHLAARFAAKEAVVKALGDYNGISWHDIKISNEKNGKPRCQLLGRGKLEILLSISHTEDYAVASALITKKA